MKPILTDHIREDLTSTAVGGWGDDIGFTEASKSDASIQQFADDVKTMLDNTGADGVGKC